MVAPAGSLRRPVWGTGSIKHQASRTNDDALQGRMEVRRERCACIQVNVFGGRTARRTHRHQKIEAQKQIKI